MHHGGMAPLLLHDLATASADVGATRSRRAKVARLADTISTATPDEVALVVAYLSGEPLQRRTGVGWASLQVVAPPAEAASVTVTELHDWLDRLAAVAGPGAKDRRRALLDSLLGRCTEEEQRFVTALLTGELRQGALAAMVVEGLAAAHGLPATDVRHAVMVQGAPGPVARALAVDGVAALATFTLEVGRPVQPMLASPASSLAAAMSAGGAVAVEEKLDGIRIQAHADRAVVTLFTRSLDDVTARLPEVVAAVTSLGLTSIVLDGEVLALTDDGRPRRFQETAGRTGSRVDVTAASRDIPLAVAFFDILHVQGDDLMGCPASERMERLAQFVPASLRVRRLVTSDLDEAESFAAQSLARPRGCGRQGPIRAL